MNVPENLVIRFFTVAVIGMATAIGVLWARNVQLEGIIHDLLKR